MRTKYKYMLLILVALAFSCGANKEAAKKKKQPAKTNKGVVTSQPNKTTKPTSSIDQYINRFAAIAKTEMRKYKVPASITLAQGILESGSGKGRLSVEANNHFGIKCHGWTGAKIYHDDDESQECFRKYKKAELSFEDHSQFLTGRKRYAKLFKLKPYDYKGWAKGLRAAGYATDKKYPQKLISLIERFQLYKYDEEVLGNKEEVIKTTNSVSHIIKKGDTLYSLSKRYNTSVEAIKSLNNLESNALNLGEELKIPN